MTDVQRIPIPRFPDVRVRTPANWTAVAFLGLLGGVHLAIAIPAAILGRWEGSLSLFFAILFLLSAIIAGCWTVEIALLAACRTIRVRTGTKRWHVEKSISFDAVTSVRLMLDDLCQQYSRIEIICQSETLEIPPTPIPNQQALFFAMMLDVPLVKMGEAEATNAAIPQSATDKTISS